MSEAERVLFRYYEGALVILYVDGSPKSREAFASIGEAVKALEEAGLEWSWGG